MIKCENVKTIIVLPSIFKVYGLGPGWKKNKVEIDAGPNQVAFTNHLKTAHDTYHDML